METSSVGHRIIMEDRRRADITGVKDLLIFDETEIVVETAAGLLNVRGAGLHMGNLSLEKGIVGLEGDIREFFYDEMGAASGPGKNKGGFGRLFKG